jgi:hypothetical protein
MEENPYKSPVDDSKSPFRSVYETFINTVRIVVAIVMAISGAIFVICANIDPGVGTDFGPRTRAIGIPAVFGVYACLITVALLCIEQIIRIFDIPSILEKYQKKQIAVVSKGNNA